MPNYKKRRTKKAGVGETEDVKEAKVDDRLSADQKEVIRNRRLSPGERLPVRGETPRDTEERLTQTRRERTARNRGGQTVRGSKGLEPWGITREKSWYPERVSARRDKLRAKRAKNNIRSFKEAKTFEEFMIEAYMIMERPYQIYGPDPHGASDSEPRPLGKPYKNKKRAKTRADKLDQEIGGYRHFVRKVDDN